MAIRAGDLRSRRKAGGPTEGQAAETERQAARVTVNLPDPVWAELTRSAQRQGITRTEALRRAVWVYLYFTRRVRDENCEVILERPGGERERLLFPY